MNSIFPAIFDVTNAVACMGVSIAMEVVKRDSHYIAVKNQILGDVANERLYARVALVAGVSFLALACLFASSGWLAFSITFVFLGGSLCYGGYNSGCVGENAEDLIEFPERYIKRFDVFIDELIRTTGFTKDLERVKPESFLDVAEIRRQVKKNTFLADRPCDMLVNWAIKNGFQRAMK